jgi:enamine deaminase RidA (YjgF/YER057c/UK114 family)
MARTPSRKKKSAAKRAKKPAARRPAAARKAPPPKIRQVRSPVVAEPNPPNYSQCLMVGDQIFLAGMTAGDGRGGIMGDGSPYDQARQCFLKIGQMLQAAGSSIRDVVKMTIYVTDMAFRPDIGRARNEALRQPMPASTMVGISSLAQPGLVVEIDAWAVKGAGV